MGQLTWTPLKRCRCSVWWPGNGPSTRWMIDNWSTSLLPGNKGCPSRSSPKMQPIAQTSTLSSYFNLMTSSVKYARRLKLTLTLKEALVIGTIWLLRNQYERDFHEDNARIQSRRASRNHQKKLEDFQVWHRDVLRHENDTNESLWVVERWKI